ncbi:MAG TPA: TylF/MycF/NovP-related O-methyltransferase [Acidobacteriaceae bacterium]|nr:TylF/MycF/NovP-related O-methyltransferase [Acidobacteriaceae bacterium]
MATSQTSEKKIEGIQPARESRLKRFFSKGPAAMLASIRWNVGNLNRETIAWLRFNVVTWEPTGRWPAFHAYYPDGLRSFPDLSDLYRRWIRANKTNNNGDATRFMALMLNLRQLQKEGIAGDFAELGVWKGNSAAILAHFASQTGRRLFLFDTFSGFDQRDLEGVDEKHGVAFADTSLEGVKETVGHPEVTTYVQGFFPDTITDEIRQHRFALAHIDCDLYQPMRSALEFFYPRMPKGGMLILHDYSSGTWDGATRAIDEFCQSTGENVTLWPDKSGTAMIRKSS